MNDTVASIFLADKDILDRFLGKAVFFKANDSLFGLLELGVQIVKNFRLFAG